MENITPYQYRSVGDIDNTYLFTTRYDVAYRVRFKPSFYVLDADPAIANHVYELVIARIEKPDGPYTFLEYNQPK